MAYSLLGISESYQSGAFTIVQSYLIISAGILVLARKLPGFPLTNV
ncbi:MAG TPA: hypothetical protein PK566_15450 [Pseudobacteroides sp.]|nr:hypothetical protein [Pseudobacteroides sp.]